MGPRVKRQIVDLALPALAMGGLSVSVFAGSSIRASADTLSDLKTLVASSWCFTHGLNAYNVSNIQARFAQQGIVQPPSWYGHAPVYPPTTLALIAPFSALPTTTALFAITFLSIFVFVAAVASLLEQPMARSSMTLGWKALVVALCASWPLIGFALSCGNLSIVSAALAILAFNHKQSRRSWLPALLLALAVLLKPHLAVWFLVAMFLLPDKQTRSVAARAGALVSGCVVALGSILAVQHTLTMQVFGLASMLRLETSPGGSMSISSREVLLTCSQISSLQSMLGFWTPDRLLAAASSVAILGGAAFWLVRTTRNAHSEEERVVAVGAWSAFGLLATYHRAHDAVALLLLLPYLLGRLRRAPADWKAWTVIACAIAMSLGPSTESLQSQIAGPGAHSLLSFLLLRQVGVLDVCLLLVLFVTLREMRHRVATLVPARAYRSAKQVERPALVGSHIHRPIRTAETPQQ